MAKTTYKEYLLSTTSFNEPKIVTGKEAVATMISRIIMLEPGTNPLHPTMGVGLASKYRFLSSSTIETSLKNDISNQIEQFLPDYQLVNVELVYNEDKTVDINIQIDDTVYVYDSSESVPITLSTILNN